MSEPTWNGRPRRRARLPIVAVLLVVSIPPTALIAKNNDQKPAETRRDSVVRFHAPPKPLPAGAVTQDWPDFLGPDRNARSKETRLLKRFPPTGPTLVWEMETGSGYAAPSVQGNRLVYFHRVDDEDVVECLDPETGRHRWTFRYPTTYKDRYDFSNGPRATPVIDENRVYTVGAAGTLHCLDLATGRMIWRHDLIADYGASLGFFGVASTPLISGDRLIVNVGGADGPCVVALNKRTGKEVWRAGSTWGASCASPIPAMVRGKRRVLVLAGGESRPPVGGLLSIDPTDGRIDLKFPFRSKRYESVNAASPVVIGDNVFVSTDYRTGCTLLSLKETGGYEQAWHNDALNAHFVTPIHHQGHLYGFHGAGGQTALVCVDVATGRQVWKEQPLFDETVERNGESETVTFPLKSGALLYADGRFLLLNEHGQLAWLDLTPNGYRELSRTTLFVAKDSWTPLALSRGLLYVVQNTADTFHHTPPRLLCYDLRAVE